MMQRVVEDIQYGTSILQWSQVPSYSGQTAEVDEIKGFEHDLSEVPVPKAESGFSTPNETVRQGGHAGANSVSERLSLSTKRDCERNSATGSTQPRLPYPQWAVKPSATP